MDYFMNDKGLHPVYLVNHLFPGCMKYCLFEQIGTIQNPLFKVFFELNQQTFEGVAGSKKLAKCEAARAALLMILEQDKNTQHLTRETKIMIINSLNWDYQKPKDQRQQQENDPALELNNLYPGKVAYHSTQQFNFLDRLQFKSYCYVDGQLFEGIGDSEKNARIIAAEVALNKLRPVNYNKLSLKNKEQENPVILLEKLFPNNVNYMSIEKSGNPKNFQFKAYLLVKDQIFWGIGDSEENSKVNAAELALKSLTSTNESKSAASSKTSSVISEIKSVEVKQQSLLSVLHDLYQRNMQFINIEQCGLLGSPQFKANLLVNGVTFYGIGVSKKRAKLKAAEIALQALTSKDDKNFPVFSKTLGNTPVEVKDNENPTSVLVSLYGAKMHFVNIEQFGVPKIPQFIANLFVDGVTFYGVGGSKKLAKLKASQIALGALKSAGNKKPPISSISQLEPSVDKSAGDNEKKHPATILNYMYAGNMRYLNIEQFGPPESPQFEANLFVNGAIFCGAGVSKASAKLKAAEIALKELASSENREQGHSSLVLPHLSSDSENIQYRANNQFEENSAKFKGAEVLSKTTLDKLKSVSNRKTPISPKTPNQLSLNDFEDNRDQEDPFLELNHLYPETLHFINIEQYGLPESLKFKANLLVNKEVFYGVGTSATSAKVKASEKVFNTLRDQQFSVTSNLITVNNFEDDKGKEHPVSVLNHLYPEKVRYTNITRFGLAESPQFTAYLLVDGQLFYGVDISETSAKLKAAEIALKKMTSLNPKYNSSSKIKEQEYPGFVMAYLHSKNVQYISVDQFGLTESPRFKANLLVNGQTFYGQCVFETSAKLKAAQKALNKFESDQQLLILKTSNPLSINSSQDNKDHQASGDIQFVNIVQFGPPESPEFTAYLLVNGQIFYGVGDSETSAKFNAAQFAIKKLESVPRKQQTGHELSVSVDAPTEDVKDVTVEDRLSTAQKEIGDVQISEKDTEFLNNSLNNAKRKKKIQNAEILHTEMALDEIINTQPSVSSKHSNAISLNHFTDSRGQEHLEDAAFSKGNTHEVVVSETLLIASQQIEDFQFSEKEIVSPDNSLNKRKKQKKKKVRTVEIMAAEILLDKSDTQTLVSSNALNPLSINHSTNNKQQELLAGLTASKEPIQEIVVSELLLTTVKQMKGDKSLQREIAFPDELSNTKCQKRKRIRKKKLTEIAFNESDRTITVSSNSVNPLSVNPFTDNKDQEHSAPGWNHSCEQTAKLKTELELRNKSKIVCDKQDLVSSNIHNKGHVTSGLDYYRRICSDPATKEELNMSSSVSKKQIPVCLNSPNRLSTNRFRDNKEKEYPFVAFSDSDSEDICNGNYYLKKNKFVRGSYDSQQSTKILNRNSSPDSQFSVSSQFELSNTVRSGNNRRLDHHYLDRNEFYSQQRIAHTFEEVYGYSSFLNDFRLYRQSEENVNYEDPMHYIHGKYPFLDYTLTDVIDPSYCSWHCSWPFNIDLKICGEEFKAGGSSKAIATHLAAKAALEFLEKHNIKANVYQGSTLVWKTLKGFLKFSLFAAGSIIILRKILKSQDT